MSSCSQDPGAQVKFPCPQDFVIWTLCCGFLTLTHFIFEYGGNEENANTLVNETENLAQDVGTNNVEVNLAGNDKGP
jgi:hypothetical protein